MNLKQKVKERIEKIKNNNMVEDNIMRDKSGRIDGIKCWKCGVQIGGHIEQIVREERDTDGTKKIYIKQIFGKFDNHGDTEFRLDKGESYTPPLCKICSKEATIEDCEKILARQIKLDSSHSRANDNYIEYLISKSVKEKIRG